MGCLWDVYGMTMRIMGCQAALVWENEDSYLVSCVISLCVLYVFDIYSFELFSVFDLEFRILILGGRVIAPRFSRSRKRIGLGNMIM